MNSEVQTKENKMGEMPVGKLLINMSLPIMISMLVQALYNIVDSIFVARLSEDALTAVSLAFPIQTLMIAVGAGTGVGVNSLLSKSLGEKRQERADKTAMNGIFLYGVSYLVFLVIGFTCVAPFYRGQVDAATQSDIFTMGVSYLTIVCTCSFGLFTQFITERLLQATGRTIYTMITQGIGAITNIILDPILIFGLLGAPKLGVAGAAIATVIGQCVGGVLGIYYNKKVNTDIHFDFKKLRPDGEIIAKIYKVGVPAIIMQAIGSVMTYGMNLILMGFSSTAAAVFGIYFKLQSFFFMPVFGLNNGMIPIIAYNYGAQKRKRVIKTIRYGATVAAMMMVVGLILFNFFPQWLLGLFDASEDMLAIGVDALHIISIHFCAAWASIIFGATFQALGNGLYSLIVSLVRQLVVLLPVAYLLAKIGGLSCVWWAFPIAEIAACTLSVIFFMRMYKGIIMKIPEE